MSEGLLTLIVLSVLSVMTANLWAEIASPLPILELVAIAIPLTICLEIVRRTRRRLGGGVKQEIALAGLMTFVLANLAGISYLAVHGSSGLLFAALMVESSIAVPVAAFAWRWVALQCRLPGLCAERVVLLGAGAEARDLYEFIDSHLDLDYRVLGFIPENGRRLEGAGLPELSWDVFAGPSGSLPDRVVVALEEKRGRLPFEKLVELRLRGVKIEEATSFLERTTGRIRVGTLLPSWLIFSDGFRTSARREVFKRTFDVVCAAVLLVLAFPLMALASALIKLDSTGAIFYRQRRVGRDGKMFTILKFRSMIENAEKDTGPAYAAARDPRITRVGRMMRKLRIDELPQIVNVLRGDMSFVGPRPERPFFDVDLRTRSYFYALRTMVRPGLTGWAQVEYRYGASEEDALEKLEYDLFYIKNCSFLLDMWIILKTIKVVLFANGAR
ncbi:MAG: sugar transferase [Acidobacteriota bacterium]|nr:MAG: sugar transferase [Acidobacteriota bacterium]